MERSAKWAGLGRARAELRGRWDHDSAAAPSVAGMRARAVPGKRRSLAASGAPKTLSGQEKKTRHYVSDDMRLSRSAHGEVSSRQTKSEAVRFAVRRDEIASGYLR